ncbi:MAG: 4Fe-4S dicluster domain-containing protein [Armatimonadetes bacterium]|nr:4Fe-4S dicluster domain-containing protein [Armatimonadota bacterium]
MNDQKLYDRTVKCIRCGFCLEACPTFVLTGQETESPRGRIYLVRSAIEGELAWDKEVLEHLDTCLGCRACEPACPSGVEYGSILEMARERLETLPVRRPMGKIARRGLLKVLTTPWLMKLGMLWPGRRLPRSLSKALSGRSPEAATPRPQPVSKAPATPEGNAPVYFLEGCVMSVMYAGTNENTRFLLRRAGGRVDSKRQCCGALDLHAGQGDKGRSKARALIDGCPENAPVVTNSAGCGGAMKEYGDLLAADPAYADRARRFSKRVRDITEHLSGADLELPRSNRHLRIAYHDACHLAHGQGVLKQPRELLRSLPGVQLVELEESDRCCGSAGIYNLTQPELARRLLERKWTFIEQTGAEIVATGNPGCLAWIQQAAAEKGSAVRVAHTVDVIAEAVRSTSL